MAIKFVSGVPGSGKSYYVMREVILKFFEWDNQFHEWKRKDDSPLNIITNIDGLRLPHINFDNHLKENEITYTQFFTRSYIKKLTEEIGQCIIILDEAQKYFPKSFKEDKSIVQSNDFENSVFYFFEYHRHLDVDVYLMAQLWTRMHPDIVGLCEYQIKAVPRTLSVVGEFRYHFCMGFDVLGKTTIKSDKKIFALYSSTESGKEVKTGQIRPIRKYAVLIILLAAAGLFFFRMSYNMLLGDSDNISQSAESMPLKKSPPVSSPVVSSPQKAGESPARRDGGRELFPAKRKYDVFQYVPNDLVKLKCGSVWSSNNLLAVEYFGELIEPDKFPYPFQVDSKTKTVTILLPRDEFLKADRVRLASRFSPSTTQKENKPQDIIPMSSIGNTAVHATNR